MFGWITRRVCQWKIADRAASVRELAKDLDSLRSSIKAELDSQVEQRRTDLEALAETLTSDAADDEGLISEVEKTCARVAGEYVRALESAVVAFEARLSLGIMNARVSLANEQLRGIEGERQVVRKAMEALMAAADAKPRLRLAAALQPEISTLVGLTTSQLREELWARAKQDRTGEYEIACGHSVRRLISRLDASSEAVAWLEELRQYLGLLRRQRDRARQAVRDSKEERASLATAERGATSRFHEVQNRYKTAFFDAYPARDDVNAARAAWENLVSTKNDARSCAEEHRSEFERSKRQVKRCHDDEDYDQLDVHKARRASAFRAMRSAFDELDALRDRQSPEFASLKCRRTRQWLLQRFLRRYQPWQLRDDVNTLTEIELPHGVAKPRELFSQRRKHHR